MGTCIDFNVCNESEYVSQLRMHILSVCISNMSVEWCCVDVYCPSNVVVRLSVCL